MEKYNFNEVGINQVGKIKLKDKVYVTDPCYGTDVWCMKYIDNIAPGEYVCFIKVSDEGTWGHRVSELHVVKESFLRASDEDLNEIPYDNEPLSCVIGVDSGQCGIFDADYYEEHQPDDDYDNLNSWYRKVCELTYHAGITDGLGVATASGYGDGSYPLFVAEEEDKIVAMKIVFIEFEEDEDNDFCSSDAPEE